MALRVAAVGLLSRVLHERREHFHTLRLGARSLQPAGAFLCRESPSTISPIYRRSSPVTRAGLAGARKSPATASVGPRLLRLLVGARRDYAYARANNSADEAVGSRERRACRKGNEEGPKRGLCLDGCAVGISKLRAVAPHTVSHVRNWPHCASSSKPGWQRLSQKNRCPLYLQMRSMVPQIRTSALGLKRRFRPTFVCI